MGEKGYDWGGFLVTEPLDEQPPLSPGTFGRLLLTSEDASDALTLLGISAQTIPDPTGHSGEFLTTDGSGFSWAEASGGGGGTWGSITGSLSGQTDLQAALDARQPLDNDLTSIAALSTTSFGRGFLPLADAGAARTYIGAGTSSFGGAFSSLSGIPTTLAGYGITDAVKAGNVMVTTAQGVATTYQATSNTDAARGTALTSAFAAHIAGDKISIGEGTYQVAAGVLDPLANVTIEGNGYVVLKAADHGATAFGGQLSIINGSGSRTDNLRIRNIVFDCNLHNQSASNATIGAVSIYGGSNSVIENCRAINWGSKDVSVECFVFINQTTAGLGSGYGNKIRNCMIDTPAPVAQAGGTSGFVISGVYTGTTPTTGWMYDSEISGCVTHDITTGSSSGQPLFFNGMGAAGAYGIAFRNNFSYNLAGSNATGFYEDTGSVIQATITGNTFLDVHDGIRLITNNTSVTTSDWLISGNQIKAVGYGIVIAPGGGTATRFVISNNYISKSSGSPVGIYYSNISKLTLSNNTFDTMTANTTAGSGTSNVTLFNNRTTSGTFITGDISPAGQGANNIWTGINQFQGFFSVTHPADASEFIVDLTNGGNDDNKIAYIGVNGTSDPVFQVDGHGKLTLTDDDTGYGVSLDMGTITGSRLIHWPAGSTGGTLCLTENTGGEQVDGLYTALLIKPSVALVAASNITLSGAQTIDGVLGTVGQTLILCVAQSTGSQNGPWIMQTGAWTRPTWYDSGNATKAKQFTTTFVRLGNTYSGSTWRMTTANVTIDTTAQTWVQTPLALTSTSVSGTLPVANGGTGITSFGSGVGIALGVNVGSAGAFVTFNGALGTPSSGTLTNCTFPTLNQNTSGSAASLSATLAVASGGTNITSYAIGDLLYASGSTTLSKLADVATGNALISGGVTTAPSWGKITTSHTTGIAASGVNTDITALTGLTAASTLTLAPAANTVATGWLLTDTTAASSGNQQYSPAVRWTGQGWKTTATAASQAVDFRAYVLPVQGTANPTAQWTLESSINGGAFGNTLTYDSAGLLTLPASGVIAGSTGLTIKNGASGDIKLSIGSNEKVRVDSGGNEFYVFMPNIQLYNNSARIAFGTSSDAILSEKSAGIIRFGTTSANSLGSWEATNGTLLGTLAVTGLTTLTGGVIDGVQALSGAGAVNITTGATAFTSTGGAQALTLADGTNGQRKTIAHVSDGGSGVLTPTTKSGYSTITFTNAGDAVSLQFFTTAGWCVIGSYGVTIA